MKSLRFTLTASAIALGLAGCGGGTSSSAPGQLSVGITDAPMDAPDASVHLQVSGIEVHGPAGDMKEIFKTPMDISLSDLVNGASTPLLSNYELPSGHYDWIRLMVDTGQSTDTTLSINSTTYALTIPSGAETGLKLIRGFDVPAGGHADFTIDFNLRQSIVENSSGYVLKPVLRIVDNSQIGEIEGTVDINTLCAGQTINTPAIYVYSGSGMSATDINTSSTTDPGPILTAPIDLNTSSYQADFLSTGEYTLALACNAGNDQPGSGPDDVGFVKPSYDVTVTADQKTQQNF